MSIDFGGAYNYWIKVRNQLCPADAGFFLELKNLQPMMAKVAYIEIDELDSGQQWRKLSHIDVLDILYVGEYSKSVYQVEPVSGYLERKFSRNFQAGETEDGLTIWRRPGLPPQLHFLSSYRARIIETTGETTSVPITMGGQDEALYYQSDALDLSYMPQDKGVCADWH